MPETPRRTVKDLLAESKDTSELMVDLAYAAVFFGDPKLASEVDHLEELMGQYIKDLRLISMLAARSPEDAEGLSDVLHLSSCIESIADAAVGISRVVSDVLGIPDALRADLRHADEVSGRVRVRAASTCVGQTLRALELPTETGMWVIAVRRGADWEFAPGPETVIGEDDVLLVRGPEEGMALIYELAGAPVPLEPSEGEGTAYNELDRAVDILVAMKNTAEVSVGLAYSALMLREPALAAEVTTLESRSDELQSELESWVLRATESAQNPEELRGLLRLAYASEAISDAARSMTRLVERVEDLHPIVAEAIEASDAVAAEAVVRPGSAADGKTLKELSFKTETGMSALAVQRNKRWIYRPAARFQLQAGDRVIATGPEDGIEEMYALAGVPEPAEAS
ncbi:MAG: potassium channel family protein, partial [Actinomycetota bacterium]